MAELSTILTYGAILVGVQLILSLVSVFAPLPSVWFCSAVQHLSAGIVTAAIAVELIPLLLEIFTPTAINYVVVISGFTFAVVAFSLLEFFFFDDPISPRENFSSGGSMELNSIVPEPNEMEAQPHLESGLAGRCRSCMSRTQFGMLFVVASGLFLDGMLYSLSYVLNSTTGFIIAIAFGVETGVLGLLTSISLRESGLSVWRVALVAISYTILTFIGILIGGVIFTEDGLELSLFFLSFASAVFLFMVIDSLLIEARLTAIPYAWASKFCFYIGFCAIFYLDLALL